MYCFADGWMFCGLGKGAVRIQLYPMPVCERWDAKEKVWVAHRPPHLFLKEAREFREGLRVDERQLELPMSGEANPLASPYRGDAGFPAHRLWLCAPETWPALAKRFAQTSWEVLNFVAACGSAAADLTVSNPGLALLLAARHFGRDWREHPERTEPLRKALRLPQIKLLPWIMLPQERWIVRFLSKLDSGLNADEVLAAVRSALQVRGAEELFRHLKGIDERVLGMIHPKILPVIHPRFLMELTSPGGLETSLDVIAWKLRDAGDIAFAGRGVPVFETLRQLEKWHWEAHGMKGKYCVTFPQPPLHGTRWIKAITHQHVLQQEAHEMHHCVTKYQSMIERGDMAVYQVFQPERATLGLILNSDGKWRIYDLRLRYNHPTAPETRDAVSRWLRESQQKKIPF